jgi:putative ATP-binding cassette transporter
VPILAFFGRELSSGRWRYFILLAAVSGISSAAVLATVNAAANRMNDGDVMAHSLVMLVLAILLFAYSQQSLMERAAELAQDTVHRLRVQLLEMLQAAELRDVEKFNRSEIYSSIDTEMRAISDGAPALMIISQSAVLTVVTMAYMAWLSLVAFVLAAGFIVLAGSFHAARNREIIQQYERLFQKNAVMMDRFSDIIEGVKEIKLNAARATELSGRVKAASASLSSRALGVQSLFAHTYVASQVTFFLLIGMIVFIAPLFTTIEAQELVKITAATLFLIGPISAVVGGLPTVQRMNAAAEVITSLHRRVREIEQWAPVDVAPRQNFERIVLENVAFSYQNNGAEDGFLVGPIWLEIRRGQVIFVTGGNGSGKSTLLKLITSLYLPSSGSLLLDGLPVAPGAEAVGYRSLFSAILSDYHLFQELYGLPMIDRARAEAYLQLLELEGRVEIIGRAFSTVALSTGLRKRLAMIVALLEDRPIYVFDEWAADQDPEMRRKFYRTILPQLKTAGKTVIAVTHDERYFDAADIRYHMDEGKLVLATGGASAGESEGASSGREEATR